MRVDEVTAEGQLPAFAAWDEAETPSLTRWPVEVATHPQENRNVEDEAQRCREVFLASSKDERGVRISICFHMLETHEEIFEQVPRQIIFAAYPTPDAQSSSHVLEEGQGKAHQRPEMPK